MKANVMNKMRYQQAAERFRFLLKCYFVSKYRIVKCYYTRSDPNGSVPKLKRIGLAFTPDPTVPNPFGPAIRTQTESLSNAISFGSDPKKISWKQMGSDPNGYGSKSRPRDV